MVSFFQAPRVSEGVSRARGERPRRRRAWPCVRRRARARARRCPLSRPPIRPPRARTRAEPAFPKIRIILAPSFHLRDVGRGLSPARRSTRVSLSLSLSLSQARERERERAVACAFARARRAALSFREKYSVRTPTELYEVARRMRASANCARACRRSAKIPSKFRQNSVGFRDWSDVRTGDFIPRREVRGSSKHRPKVPARL